MTDRELIEKLRSAARKYQLGDTAQLMAQAADRKTAAEADQDVIECHHSHVL